MTEDYLEDIADAIRGKLSSSDTYTPGQMAGAIESIPSGGITPTGTINITENGSVDVTQYATANVNVSGGGDDSFSLKNYIESSGTQYIDTGYIAKDNSRFDVVYNTNASQPVFPTLFGVRDNDSGATAGRCTFFVKHGNFGSGSYAWGTADASMGLPALMYLSAKKQRCVFTKGSLLVQQADGNALTFDFSSPYSASNTLSVYIFTLNQGGYDFDLSTHFYGKLYRFRIYEGETLVHEFLPWLDGNNVACLKDTVTGDLKYNAGTGTFTYGTDA